jgi:myo-inositol-1(or 4)-monophosphatase
MLMNRSSLPDAPSPMPPTLTIALRACRQAGEILLRRFERLDDRAVHAKGAHDYVTLADREAQESIVSELTRAYPGHRIVAEEGGLPTVVDTENVWYLDPLDGTTNFIHGYPAFAVSLAHVHRGKLEAAVVYDPLHTETFVAARGEGAYLNERRIRAGRRRGLEHALVATGFPIADRKRRQSTLRMLRAVLAATDGVRRGGAASLDLAYVAAGRLDAYWELGLKPWDLAAGSLIVVEAGGLVGDLHGGDRYLETGDIVAAASGVYPAFLHLLQNLEANASPVATPR